MATLGIGKKLVVPGAFLLAPGLLLNRTDAGLPCGDGSIERALVSCVMRAESMSTLPCAKRGVGMLSSFERDLVGGSRRLIRRHVAGYHMYLSAGRAESLVAMKSLVGLTVVFPENFDLLHLAIVFFRDGKKLQQPCLEQLVRLGRFFEKFPAPRT